MRPCEQFPVGVACMHDKQQTYIGFPSIRSWYHAYDQCEAIGGSLAVLDTSDQLKRVLTFMKNHITLKNKDFLYIGLTNHKWIPTDIKFGKHDYI